MLLAGLGIGSVGDLIFKIKVGLVKDVSPTYPVWTPPWSAETSWDPDSFYIDIL